MSITEKGLHMTGAADTPAVVLAQHIVKGDVAQESRLRDIYRRAWPGLTTCGQALHAASILGQLGAVVSEVRSTKGRPAQWLKLAPDASSRLSDYLRSCSDASIDDARALVSSAPSSSSRSTASAPAIKPARKSAGIPTGVPTGRPTAPGSKHQRSAPVAGQKFPPQVRRLLESIRPDDLRLFAAVRAPDDFYRPMFCDREVLRVLRYYDAAREVLGERDEAAILSTIRRFAFRWDSDPGLLQELEAYGAEMEGKSI